MHHQYYAERFIRAMAVHLNINIVDVDISRQGNPVTYATTDLETPLMENYPEDDDEFSELTFTSRRSFRSQSAGGESAY